MPDYDLYKDWIEAQTLKAQTEALRKGLSFNKSNYLHQFKEYTDYSIGFLTRGCFRKCEFCVNKKYDHVFSHSPLSEFFDKGRKKICLLDDNFLGCPQWRELLKELIATGYPFKFKQGIDERLLTEERCKMLFGANYDGWKDKAKEYASRYEKEMAGLNNQFITEHRILADGVTATVYEDNTVVYVNTTVFDYTDETVTIPAREYLVERSEK